MLPICFLLHMFTFVHLLVSTHINQNVYYCDFILGGKFSPDGVVDARGIL